MTELRSAEWWFDRVMRKPFAGLKDTLRFTIPEIRDIQRNAERHHLERAAKAVCPDCEMGTTRDGTHHTYHVGNGTLCHAAAIWKLIPNDPALAVEHLRGGIVLTHGKTPSGNDVMYMRAPILIERRGGSERVYGTVGDDDGASR